MRHSLLTHTSTTNTKKVLSKTKLTNTPSTQLNNANERPKNSKQHTGHTPYNQNTLLSYDFITASSDKTTPNSQLKKLRTAQLSANYRPTNAPRKITRPMPTNTTPPRFTIYPPRKETSNSTQKTPREKKVIGRSHSRAQHPNAN